MNRRRLTTGTMLFMVLSLVVAAAALNWVVGWSVGAILSSPPEFAPPFLVGLCVPLMVVTAAGASAVVISLVVECIHYRRYYRARQ